MNIFVGNLNFDTADSDLNTAFSQFGTVDSAQVIKDRDSGRSRGFGFVEMSNDDEARNAIQDMNGTDLGGRQLTVNEAKPRNTGGGGGGGGYRGGGGGGGGGSRW